RHSGTLGTARRKISTSAAARRSCHPVPSPRSDTPRKPCCAWRGAAPKPARRGGSRTQAFGEVAQGIIAKDSADPQGSSRRRPHPGLDGPKGVLPQNEADQDGPQQGGRRDLRARTAIAGGAEVSGQAPTLGGVFPQSARRRTFHRGFLFFRCWRAKTKSRALAASTSRTAS